MEKLMKEMHAVLSPERALPFLLIPEYSEINKEQRIHDRQIQNCPQEASC